MRIALAPLILAFSATVACNALVGFGDLEKSPTSKDDPDNSSSSGKGDDDDTTSSSSSSSGQVGSSSGAASSSSSSGVVVTPKCDPTKPFGTATPLLGNINSGSFEDGGSLTADELTIVFLRGIDQNKGQLMIATRASLDAAFADPTVIGAAGTANNWPPWISTDGLTLYWSVLSTTMDIFMSTRGATTAGFTDKQSSPFQNNGYDEFRPAITADGNEMFFLSNKNSAALRTFHSLKTGGTFGTPTEITELNPDGGGNGSVAITPDGLTMYFASDRAGSTGSSYDVYLTHRDTRTSAFTAPTRVTEVSTADEEVPSFISSDGCRLYFGSDRTGAGDLFVAVKPL